MDKIQFLYSIIGTPLGYILYFIYQFICSNVGIAILLFTLIIKLAMLPLAIKQQKNTAKYKPMTHIEHVPSSKIEEIIEESYSVELTSIFVNEVSLDATELTDMKEEAVQKHNDIVKDAKLVIDYYNAHCLKDGEAPKELTLFDDMTVQAKEVVNASIRRSTPSATLRAIL